MPEGDTIHRGARIMRPLLQGKTIRSARSRWPLLVRDLPGKTVTAVDVRGKHLLIGIDDASVLRVHLGMEGSWSRYEPNDQVRSRTIGLCITTDEDMFVCFHPRDVERLEQRRLHLHPTLARLGPDLAAGPVPPDAITPRVAALLQEVHAHGDELTLADLLRDQTPACGIGNVFACEVLFLVKAHPFRSAFDVEADLVHALYGTANRVLMAALDQPRRNTTGRRRPELWVYGRGGEPCLVCATAIARWAPRLQSVDERVTYWCPRCQPTKADRASTEGTLPTRRL